MPPWTLRLVACAGLVALLGRMPVLTSLSEAFLVGLGLAALVLGALAGATALPPVLSSALARLRPTAGGGGRLVPVAYGRALHRA